MLITTCIIVTVSLILSILLLLQNKKNQVLFMELVQRMEQLELTTPHQFDKLSQEFIQHMNQQLTETKETISQQLKDDLHTYLAYDQLRQNEWKQLIENQRNQRTKLQYLESALNKFPDHRYFFEEYMELLKDTLTNATDRAKPTIIEKMNHTSRIFFDHCRAEDAYFAQQEKDETIRLGHVFMEEFNLKQERNLKTQVDKLNQFVLNSKENMYEIEKLDESINKGALKKYPKLLQRYQIITKKLAAEIMEKPSEEKIQTYNLKAVEAFKRAHEYFKNNESSVKTGATLPKVIKELGGWKLQYLTQPTQIYYQNIYSEIFSKLDANIKPEMTERILKAPTKEI